MGAPDSLFKDCGIPWQVNIDNSIGGLQVKSG
jgi:hypothetical protein